MRKSIYVGNKTEYSEYIPNIMPTNPRTIENKQHICRNFIKCKVQMCPIKHLSHSKNDRHFINRGNKRKIVVVFVVVISFLWRFFQRHNTQSNTKHPSFVVDVYVVFPCMSGQKEYLFLFLNCFWAINWIKNHHFGACTCDS